MSDIDTLKSLQQRIREATGPDRELDLAIGKALLPGKWRGEHCYDTPWLTSDPDGLGACVALQREVLPGWDFELTSEGRCGDFWTTLYPINDDDRARILGPDDDRGLIRISKSLCGSFLDAIISAKIAELEAKEEADAALSSTEGGGQKMKTSSP